MNLDITPGAFGIRPQVAIPDKKFLVELTELGMRELVGKHYELLAKSSVKGLFPDTQSGLEFAKKKSSDFFIQICGGEAHFNKNRGKPMMAARHAPFLITPSVRLVWLECYKEIVPDLKINEALVMSFWRYLDIFSIWMINSPENEVTKVPEAKKGMWAS